MYASRCVACPVRFLIHVHTGPVAEHPRATSQFYVGAGNNTHVDVLTDFWTTLYTRSAPTHRVFIQHYSTHTILNNQHTHKPIASPGSVCLSRQRTETFTDPVHAVGGEEESLYIRSRLSVFQGVKAGCRSRVRSADRRIRAACDLRCVEQPCMRSVRSVREPARWRAERG